MKFATLHSSNSPRQLELAPVFVKTNPTISQYFHDGIFFVNKSSCAFSAIGGHHGTEQENRSLKVLGGVKGMLLNKAALD